MDALCGLLCTGCCGEPTNCGMLCTVTKHRFFGATLKLRERETTFPFFPKPAKHHRDRTGPHRTRSRDRTHTGHTRDTQGGQTDRQTHLLPYMGQFSLVEVPAGTRAGATFHVSVPGGKLPVVCPSDARAGDVLRIQNPQATKDDFLRRVGDAEARDSHRGASKQHELAENSVLYGWRVRAPQSHSSQAAFNPYMTEQQQQQQLMQRTHQQALVRAQQKEQKDALANSALVASGTLAAFEIAHANSAPPLAMRPLAAQRAMMKSMEAQQQAVMRSRGPPPPQARAANAAIAQRQATRIAQQQQAFRDPRGKAFINVAG